MSQGITHANVKALSRIMHANVSCMRGMETSAKMANHNSGALVQIVLNWSPDVFTFDADCHASHMLMSNVVQTYAMRNE